MAQNKFDRQQANADRFGKKVLELRDRLLFVADSIAPERGKYAWLEKRTGVAASKWQNLYLEKQLPTVQMLLAVVHLDPQYGKWILTGLPNVDATIEKATEKLGEAETEDLRILAFIWRDETPDIGSWKDWLADRQSKRPKQRNDDQEE